MGVMAARIVTFVWVPLLAYGLYSLRTHSGNHDPPHLRATYGEWAMVAGASEGLGAAWADELCGNGINVLLIARRNDKMQELAQRLLDKHSGSEGGCRHIDTLVQDLSADPHELEERFQDLLKQDSSKDFGLLVYNAAYSRPGNFLAQDLDSQLLTVDVNVRGVLALTHAFAKHLASRQRSGGIVLMSSLAGLVGTGGVATYGATKSWITAFANALAWELDLVHSEGDLVRPVDVQSCVAGATRTPSYEAFEATSSRSDPTVQDPHTVVSECLQALGVTHSVATGPVNKLVRFFFRALPPSVAVDVISRETLKRQKPSQ